MSSNMIFADNTVDRDVHISETEQIKVLDGSSVRLLTLKS